MLKTWAAGILMMAFTLSLFFYPVSVLVYEVNQKVQNSGSRFKEVSLAICTASCTIRETIMVEQASQTQVTPPVKVSADFPVVYWQDADTFQLICEKSIQKFKFEFFDPFIQRDFADIIFVPPRVKS